MKNFIFGVLALGIMVAFFACQKDNNLASTDENLINLISTSDNKESVSVEQLPSNITSYVDMSFTPVEIESAWRVRGSGFEVELEDGQDLYFREDGNCLGRGDRFRGRPGFRCMHGEEIDASALPQSVTDYIASNYPAETIEKAVTKPNGGHAVKLSDGTILLFTPDGLFFNKCGDVQGPGGGPGGDGPRGGCAVGDTIDVATLPTAVTDYVAANYASETIIVAVLKPSGKFGVELSSGTVLLFGADGNFLRECDATPPGPHGHHGEVIDPSALPQAAQDYIATNYPDATIEKAVLFDNGNFGVRLSNGTRILFDGDGNVIFDSGN